MRIELNKRDGVSTLFAILSPFVALALTLIAGVILFLALGKDPIAALYSFFIEPLTEIWSLHELAIKAAPLILIAVGLSVCFRSNNWNIGAEGQFIIGAMAGSILPVVTSLETLKDAGQEAGPQDERSLCDLMIDQVRGVRRADWD